MPSFLLFAACGGDPAPTPEATPAPDIDHHAHDADHFSDPERFVAEWNSPERDAWQKPEEILAAMNISPGDTVVDLGAGTGYLEPRLSQAVGADGTVIAADVQPTMLQSIDDAAKKEGWANVRTHKAGFSDPGLEPVSVDAMVALDVWHHIEDRGAYAARVLAELKPGGRFVVVDYLPEVTEGHGPPVEMRVPAEQVVEELKQGGLLASIVEESLPRQYIVRGVRPE